MSAALLVFDRRMLDHDPGHGHPEHAGRVVAAHRAIAAAKLPGVIERAADPIGFDDLRRVHGASYLERLEALRGRTGGLDPDTAVSPGSVRAAEVAAGAVAEAVEWVVQGQATRAFALVRPPGHHAEPEAGMGFCLLSSVAVAAARARAVHGLRKIAVLDWDVHHGNGTQACFYGDPDVLVIDVHQSPLYPGSGAVDEVGKGAGIGATVNLPLPPGAGDAAWLAALRDVAGPVLEAFRPELLLVSAGFDAHDDDPLGGLRVSDRGFAAATSLVRGWADALCDGRLVLALEGGYDEAALARCGVAALQELTRATASPVPAADELGDPRERAAAAALTRTLRAAHARHWAVLGEPLED